MGILDIASGNSIWRGYDYYKENRVLSYKMVNEKLIEGVVLGSSGEQYSVVVDIPHPKRSTCDCPHAEGTRRICKHKMAVYFSAFPDAAQKLLDDLEAYEEEREQRAERTREEVIKFVRKLKKDELQELVLDLLLSGPDWQYEHFVRDNLGE